MPSCRHGDGEHGKHAAGGSPEGIVDLPPEEAIAKLQRQNARLRRKAETALELEQENAQLKTQLQEVAAQMVCCQMNN